MNTFKLLTALLLSALLYGCYHPIEIIGEGDIWSTGGRTCSLEDYQSSLDNCINNEVTGDYRETYYGEPRTGWVFDRWEIYCKNAVDNTCSFNIGAAAVALLDGVTVPPLRAIFRPAGSASITDTISENDRLWTQPDNFMGLSWNQINAACPLGACADDAILNGFSMAGWHWASVDDINSLLNAYIGVSELGPGADTYTELGSTWAPAVFLAGWRPTYAHTSGAALLIALTADRLDANTAYAAEMQELPGPANFDSATTAKEYAVSVIAPFVGAIFYR